MGLLSECDPLMPQKPLNLRTRRDFFKHAAKLSAGAGVAGALLASIEEAFAIDPAEGSTYLDAEHIVVLMQENRSFDHAYGALRGVRGFNDPRAVTLPDQKPVWAQTNSAGDTYAPFHLDIKETNVTWLGSLPHGWRDQNDALNRGNNDQWLDAKPSGHKDCAGMPLTMGYFDRQDIPFYYALADAFTICDHNFCSSLTGTTPNRLYLWTGTIREKHDTDSAANVRNSDVYYNSTVTWTTFPERLEDAGISWRVYQNEISYPSGLNEDARQWVSNFTNNPLEWFDQYNVGFRKTGREFMNQIAKTLPDEIRDLDQKIANAAGAELTKLQREKKNKSDLLEQVKLSQTKNTDAAFEKLTPRERSLHRNAFYSNDNEPAYREVTPLRYREKGEERELLMPKGDLFAEFRKDVDTGKLPTVSWLIAPGAFSDHPGYPWYGAWYLSEAIRILTKNPEVWMKTIFILTYDENDGYFDHVPPFIAPDVRKQETGKTSAGIDASVEYWPLERDRKKHPVKEARGGSIGLGFRVPMVIASPWSRGGNVCSEVFDHTSVIQLMEKVLSHKTGKQIRETNITTWRRAVCGDLSSTFLPYQAKDKENLKFHGKEEVLEGIHKAKFKQLPSGFQKISAENLAQYQKDRFNISWMPQQEPGTRPSTALPYQLYANGKMSADGKALDISLEARNELFKDRSAGSPFHVYTPGKFRQRTDLRVRHYAVEAGHQVADSWAIDGFENNAYHLNICGPNGFLRGLRGSVADPLIDIQCEYVRKNGAPTGDLELIVTNRHAEQNYKLQFKDHAYKSSLSDFTVKRGAKKSVPLNLRKSFSWYDFSITIDGAENFERRFAGRVETGKLGLSDPYMGRIRI